jgi:tetratricopeptide repeat protein 21B
VSGRNPKILAITLSLLQKGRKLSPLSAELCLEMAQQTLMLDEYEKAYALF